MNKKIVEFCAFCDKKKSDVNVLITGNTGNICDACVIRAGSIIKEEKDSLYKQQVKRDLELLKPLEIKNYLDQYIIGQNQVKKVLSGGYGKSLFLW